MWLLQVHCTHLAREPAARRGRAARGDPSWPASQRHVASWHVTRDISPTPRPVTCHHLDTASPSRQADQWPQWCCCCWRHFITNFSERIFFIKQEFSVIINVTFVEYLFAQRQKLHCRRGDKHIIRAPWCKCIKSRRTNMEPASVCKSMTVPSE